MSLQVTDDIKQKKWLPVFLLVMIQLRFAINLAGMNTDAFSAFVPNDSAASKHANLDKDHL